MTSRLLLLSALSLVACGGVAVPPKPAAQPSSGARIAPPASAPAEPASGDPSPPETATASGDPAAPFHGEDPGAKTKLAGPRAWVLTETGIGLYELVKLEGTKALFKGFGGDGEFKVPQAFTFAQPEAQKLEKGATVLYTVVTDGQCARVLEIHDGSAKVAYEWASKVHTRDISINELLVLDGSLRSGAPVLFHQSADDPDWQDSLLAYQDGKTAWLSNGEKVPLANVRAMDVAKPRKAGDQVLARESGGSTMRPATIKKVLDSGVRYEVEFAEEKQHGTALICTVVSVPK